MTIVSVADILAMPVVKSGAPRVLAGCAGLERSVRWVHTTELADIAPLLRGGDLVLTTGIALPETPHGLQQFAGSLAASDSAGLMIELGRRWSVVPEPLVAAFDAVDLPLIALRRELRFATVAQAVGERIVDEQLAELREAERVHETFTELSVSEAGPTEILEAVQRLSGVVVVLEGDQHQVLDYHAGPDDAADFLADWHARSRRVDDSCRTTWDEANGWLVTRLGRRERGWGRLVLQISDTPTHRQITIAERAATALALHRLHDRQRDSQIRRTHHELMLSLLADPTSLELVRRCELAGIPTSKRQFVGMTVRLMPSGDQSAKPAVLREETIAAAVHAAHEMRVPALVCEIEHDVRLLLSVPFSAKVDRITEAVAQRIARRNSVLIGVGRAFLSIGQADKSMREAGHVVNALRPGDDPLVLHRLEDVHLRGLLTLFGDDDRLRMFIDRELSMVRAHDQEWGGGLEDALRALLEHPTNKTSAAASIHLSRPAFYDRLSRLERLLNDSLDESDVRASLQVALMASDLIRSTPSPSRVG